MASPAVSLSRLDDQAECNPDLRPLRVAYANPEVPSTIYCCLLVSARALYCTARRCRLQRRSQRCTRQTVSFCWPVGTAPTGSGDDARLAPLSMPQHCARVVDTRRRLCGGAKQIQCGAGSLLSRFCVDASDHVQSPSYRCFIPHDIPIRSVLSERKLWYCMYLACILLLATGPRALRARV